QKAIRAAKVGSNVAVTVIRNTKEKSLTINIDEQPGNMSGRKYVTVRAIIGQTSLNVGLAVETLSSEEKKGHGVLVRHVVSNSPAERAGIIPGDIIIRVGSSDVKTASEFQSVLKGFVDTGVSVSLLIKSKGYVTLKY
ncbi:MAG TPA: PDZ domain-containing protein, partial [Candidatus Scalindua sp.]|nr:PDZ domain-containing protein [Candidatus Scalindua sp.]